MLLGGTLLFMVTYFVRVFALTARCANDESRYLQIVFRVGQGEAWPVSGPAFVALVTQVGRTFDVSQQSALGLTGLFGCFALIATVCFLYARWVPQAAFAALCALACSTYFWASLSQSRPQLLGGVLLLWAAALMRAVMRGGLRSRRWWWGLCLACVAVGGLAASVHIFSFFVIASLGAACVAGTFLGAPQERAWRLLCLLAPVLLGSAIVFWPGGMYALLLKDIRFTHLQHSERVLTLSMLVLLLFAGLSTLIRRYAARRGQRYIVWSSLAADLLSHSKPDRVIAALGLLVGAAIGAQAVLLPARYLAAYGDSMPDFLVSQLGNTVFCIFFLSGLHEVLLQINARTVSPELWDIVVLVTGFGVIALGLLAASTGLLDTNWMLRMVDFFVLVAAPVVGVGLSRQFKRAPSMTLLVLACAMGFSGFAGNKSALFFSAC